MAVIFVGQSTHVLIGDSLIFASRGSYGSILNATADVPLASTAVSHWLTIATNQRATDSQERSSAW